MPDWEREPTLLEVSPPAEVPFGHSADTISVVQKIFGGIDEEAARDAATIAMACPVGEGDGLMSLGDIIENKHKDPTLARIGKKVVEGIMNEAKEEPKAGPEDLLVGAFGKRAVQRDAETGALARLTPMPETKPAEQSQDSKKK